MTSSPNLPEQLHEGNALDTVDLEQPNTSHLLQGSDASVSRSESLSDKKVAVDDQEQGLREGFEVEKPRLEPPDGGRQAWLQVLGAFMLFFNDWGLFTAFGAFQTFYEVELLRHKTPSEIAWIGTFQGFMMVFIGLISGPLADRGHVHIIVIVATFCMVFAHMMLSLSTEYYQVFLTQGVIAGFGMGLIYVPSLSVVSTYFSTKRPLALGVCSTGASIGGVIYPIIFRRLQASIGFPWAARVFGFIILATQILPIFIMKPLNPPVKKKTLLDNTALRDIAFLSAMFATFLFYAGIYIPYTFISTFGLFKLRLSENLSFYLLSILNTGQFFGRLTLGAAAGKFGAFPCFQFAMASCAVLTLAWIGIDNLGGTIVFAFLYGFFSGGVTTLLGAVVVVLCPSLEVMGTRFGMGSVLVAFAVLVSSPIASATSNPEEAHFVGVQTYAGVVMAVGALGLTFPQILLRRQGRK